MRAIIIIVMLLTVAIVCNAQFDSCRCTFNEKLVLFHKVVLPITADSLSINKKGTLSVHTNLTDKTFHHDFGNSIIELGAVVFIEPPVRKIMISYRENFFSTTKYIRSEKSNATIDFIVSKLNEGFANEKYRYDSSNNVLHVISDFFPAIDKIKSIVQLIYCSTGKQFRVQVFGADQQVLAAMP